MPSLKSVWKWLDGKKSWLGWGILFAWGGLSALGQDYPELKQFGEFVLGVGLTDKLRKMSK